MSQVMYKNSLTQPNQLLTFAGRHWLLAVTLAFAFLLMLTQRTSWAAALGSPTNQTLPTLTIQKVGNGTVVTNPPTGPYTPGQTVSLTATADFGWKFVNWSGDLATANNPATLVMNNNKTVKATFTQQAASTVISDDFNQCTLKSPWTFSDPVGDVTLVKNGEQVELQIPAGVGHDIWTTGNRAPRLMQPANNVDFEVEVKFDAPVTQRFQMQGVLIEENSQNFLRINFQTDGSVTRLVAYSFTAEAPTEEVLEEVGTDAPLYLRIRRTKDQWKLFHSTNGTNWNSSAALEFAHSLTVTKVGLFAGNAGANPAFTAVVDYFFNTAARIAPEDPVKNTIPVTLVGEGSVTKSCGSPLSLKATPALGWKFSGWSGSLTGNQNPASLTIAGNQAVTATFVRKPLQLTVTTSGSGSVLLSPNQLYFDNGEEVMVTAVANSGWAFANWSGDLSGTALTQKVVMTGNKAIVANFRLLEDSSGISSDDFNACALNSGRWSFVDPLGDSGLNLSGSQAEISVPEGVDHDVWLNGNRAPRLMQATANTDFEVETKFESVLNERYQFQGILVEGDANNFIRFDFQFDGVDTRIIAISFAGGSPTIHVNQAIAQGSPLYMRVLRAADSWSLYYSYNGEEWITSEALRFTYQVVVTKVGLFAGNAGSNPAFTSVVDYFFNTAQPISPEDPVVNSLPSITIVGEGSVTRNPTCGNPVTLTATPAQNWQFAGWSGDLTGTASPVTVTAVGGEAITATFIPLSGFYSDDFNACNLDTNHWTLIDPRGDATLAIVGVQQLELSVPAGVDHDIYPIPDSTEALNRAPRIMQTINNVDFELEVKFSSEVRRQYQLQGLLIEQDSQNFLRFDFNHDGSTPKLLIIDFVNGSPGVIKDEVLSGDAPWYMRVTRLGDAWTVSYSHDGSSWTESTTFTQPLVPTQAGVFAGNAGRFPAHTAIVDYIFENRSRIDPEDGLPNQLTLIPDGSGTVTKSPNSANYSCNAEVQVKATAADGWVFAGWSGALTGTQNPATITMDRGKTVTALFKEKKFNLSFTSQGGVNGQTPGTTTATVAGPYYEGQRVKLTATPNAGYKFVKWIVGTTEFTEAEIEVTIRDNETYTAVFERIAGSSYQLYMPIITR